MRFAERVNNNHRSASTLAKRHDYTSRSSSTRRQIPRFLRPFVFSRGSIFDFFLYLIVFFFFFIIISSFSHFTILRVDTE